MNFHGRRAYLYVRISDEDQSNYSLEDQQDRLTRFCKSYEIKVIASFTDDGYSAKSFDRPGWKQLLAFIKTHKGAADLLLFTNWSRFSRAENMGETYFQIANLNRLGLEVQAVEQQVDLSIPESYHLLSIYITSPMVENLRRANNIKRGVRRSCKSGRWCNRAPFGYRNSRDEKGKPLMVPDPDRAKVVREIFESYHKGQSPILIIKRAKRNGLKITGHSTFERIICNPLYAGLITIEPWADEKGETVKAIHEPIVSQSLYQVCKSKWLNDTAPKPRVFDDCMPLRGLLRCDSCGNLMTGGRSRGKSGRYWYYYRCLRCKGENHSADKAHSELKAVLNSISLKKTHISFLISEVDREMKQILKGHREEIVRLRREIKALQERQQSLEEKYIENKLSFEVYEKYDEQFRTEVAGKTLRLNDIDVDGSSLIELYRKALPKMENLYSLYETIDFEQRQELLRLIFVEGLFLSKINYRTPKLNHIFSVQATASKGLSIMEKEYTALKKVEIEKCGGSGNQIKALLEFIMRVAA